MTLPPSAYQLASIQRGEMFACCAKPSIAILDYTNYTLDREPSLRINRVCTKCWTHWFGKPHRIRKYKRAAWDALVQADYELDLATCRAELSTAAPKTEKQK